MKGRKDLMGEYGGCQRPVVVINYKCVNFKCKCVLSVNESVTTFSTAKISTQP